MPDTSVLVVDDELIRDLISSALRIAGFATAAVANGPDALAAVERQRPDLVVLDVGLPRVDGFEVCRRLRAAGDQTPVVFLTARDAHEDKDVRVHQGGRRLPDQAVRLEEVVARVQAVLRRTAASATSGSSSRLRYPDLGPRCAISPPTTAGSSATATAPDPSRWRAGSFALARLTVHASLRGAA